MRWLVTNDDGVDALGIRALTEVASRLGTPTVVAPAGALSGCSHRVTSDDPFQVTSRDARTHVVHGTPADCVRVGLHALATDTDWVLSGINHGANLGVDVLHSGTVAAVREGVLHGKPGIALSHYRKRSLPGFDEPEFDWQRIVDWLEPIVRDLVQRPWQPGTFWNVNVPHLPPGAPPPETVFCPIERSPLPLEYRRDGETWIYSGSYPHRPRVAGSDVDVCFNGHIAVTLLSVF
jgi:5'-nucleotidase